MESIIEFFLFGLVKFVVEYIKECCPHCEDIAELGWVWFRYSQLIGGDWQKRIGTGGVPFETSEFFTEIFWGLL